ncbi:MAG: type II toxin-antitoxin system HicB family antitoxin [Rhodocyclaceae bacterium]|nr:type II toxin-antitoxin system HicB family antitoxin [Rhodocyclaceae bacterium]
MTALTVRLPNSLHAKVRELAARDDISVNQFIASAVAEKLASMLTLDYLRQEAAKGRREDFERYLSAIPEVPDESERR